MKAGQKVLVLDSVTVRADEELMTAMFEKSSLHYFSLVSSLGQDTLF